MSGRSRAQRRALEAVTDDDIPLTPLGSCRAQPSGENSVYVNYPRDQALAYGIDPGTEFYQFLDSRTGALISVPKHLLDDGDEEVGRHE